LRVEDVNENAPICRTENLSIKVEENGDVPLVLTTIECHDMDEGSYGQVNYKLEMDAGDEELFSLTQTKDGKGVLKLLQPLDYDRKFLYQLRVIAMDRSTRLSIQFWWKWLTGRTGPQNGSSSLLSPESRKMSPRDHLSSKVNYKSIILVF